MKQDHQNDGDCPESLDVGAKAPIPRARCQLRPPGASPIESREKEWVEVSPEAASAATRPSHGRFPRTPMVSN